MIINPPILIWVSRVIYTLSALFLLGILNIEDVDSELYLLGGSCTSAAQGVEGSFDPWFLLSLAIVNLLILVSGFRLLLSGNTFALLIGSLANTGLYFLAAKWEQKRLFEGYEITPDTNMLDALTGKCYLFYGPHDMILLFTSLMCIGIIWALIKSK